MGISVNYVPFIYFAVRPLASPSPCLSTWYPTWKVASSVTVRRSSARTACRMAAVTSRAYDLDASGAAIVRVKPINAGGGGVERSGAGLADGEGALRFGGDLRGIRVMTRAGATACVDRHPAVTRQCRTLRPVSTLPH